MCLVVFRKGKCRLELNLRCLEKSMENEYEVECGLQLVWFWRSDIFDNIDDIKKIDFVNSQLSMKIPWRAFFASHPTLSIRAVPPETAGCWNWSQKMLFQTDCRFSPISSFLGTFDAPKLDETMGNSWLNCSLISISSGWCGWHRPWWIIPRFRWANAAWGCQQGKDQVWLPTDPKWGLTCSITRLWILNTYHHIICTHLYAWCSCSDVAKVLNHLSKSGVKFVVWHPKSRRRSALNSVWTPKKQLWTLNAWQYGTPLQARVSLEGSLNGQEKRLFFWQRCSQSSVVLCWYCACFPTFKFAGCVGIVLFDDIWLSWFFVRQSWHSPKDLLAK